jgi:hypothetical protein
VPSTTGTWNPGTQGDTGRRSTKVGVVGFQPTTSAVMLL